MIAEIERMTVEPMKLSDEEIAMSVTSASAITWGRTTLVKMQTAENYEVIGMYTVGGSREREDSDPVRLTMARGNAMQRLQHARQRRQSRVENQRAAS